ncbi:hypothetical protein AB5J72_49840 [Streptomyces sp. CG1]|uniref:hypothetical protein n=1 Tax=Streptomyces sp. CG1 TaxID=1287523 RepID=UPI0034E2EB57
MGHIVRKLSDAAYPGFDEFRTYFDSCSDEFPAFAPAVTPVIAVKDSQIQFEGQPEDVDAVLNKTEFRWMWNLLPAGTDAFVAFVQLYALKYAKLMGLDGLKGTYTIRVRTYLQLTEHQNEAQLSQNHRMHLTADENSWGPEEVTICL